MPSNSDIWPPKSYDPILSDIGRILFNFNALENSVRRHLWSLATNGREDDIIEPLIVHMGNIPLMEAVRTTATEFHDGWIQTKSLELCEVFDRTREYRNYYAHGFNTVKLGGSAELRTKSARGRVAKHHQEITPADAAWLATWCTTAAGFGASVYVNVMQELRDVPHEKREPLRDKPLLPDRLKKPRQYLRQP